MTRPVLLTIDLGGKTISQFQQVCGEIVSEGKSDSGEEFVVFSDTESERKIPKHRIKKITDVESSA